MLKEEILKLKKERNAIILAHNYQVPEVQDIADFVGDSLELSRKASQVDANVIVFCGVKFMAETAKILNPDKKVLIPDLDAGCSLADSINLEQLRKWKSEHPNAIVVCYINTNADIKTECDYCCTSSNAIRVIQSIPEDKEILFLPDMYLGMWIKKQTGRENIHIWPGECHVHAGFRYEDLLRKMEENPDAEVMLHPECGCTTQCLYHFNGNVKVLSTSGMIRNAKESKSNKFIVVTETGILYPLKKASPQKEFIPADENAICKYMKMITLEKVFLSLKELKYEIDLSSEIIQKASIPIRRMLQIA
ncbi:MAG: quinolinate synthase NadA [candidate division WOR-3 bacterium]|nr:quinolinate synthase NadA [candidate division WOR-3 bacterium]MDW8149950.1 quinolinate synthase NadA [candidate division WOR-3 bacterium]